MSEFDFEFARFAETLNGRAAMFGFVIGVATELLTGKGIVAQVLSIFDHFPFH